MNEETIKALADTTPAAATGRFAIFQKFEARIRELEAELGVPHRLPIFNLPRCQKRISELENLIAEKIVLASSAVHVAQSAAAIAPASVAVAAVVVPSNVISLDAYLGMSIGSRSQFAFESGKLKISEFNKLPPAAKSEFCRNGGQLFDDAPARPYSAFGNHRPQDGFNRS